MQASARRLPSEPRAIPGSRMLECSICRRRYDDRFRVFVPPHHESFDTIECARRAAAAWGADKAPAPPVVLPTIEFARPRSRTGLDRLRLDGASPPSPSLAARSPSQAASAFSSAEPRLRRTWRSTRRPRPRLRFPPQAPRVNSGSPANRRRVTPLGPALQRRRPSRSRPPVLPTSPVLPIGIARPMTTRASRSEPTADTAPRAIPQLASRSVPLVQPSASLEPSGSPAPQRSPGEPGPVALPAKPEPLNPAKHPAPTHPAPTKPPSRKPPTVTKPPTSTNPSTPPQPPAVPSPPVTPQPAPAPVNPPSPVPAPVERVLATAAKPATTPAEPPSEPSEPPAQPPPPAPSQPSSPPPSQPSSPPPPQPTSPPPPSEPSSPPSQPLRPPPLCVSRAQCLVPAQPPSQSRATPSPPSQPPSSELRSP